MKGIALGSILAALVFAGAATGPGPLPAVQSEASGRAFWAISVPDLDATIDWYSTHLGFRLIHSDGRGDIRVALLQSEDAVLEAVSIPTAVPRGQLTPPIERDFHLHGVFKVGMFVDDLDARVSTLRSQGVEFVSEIYHDPNLDARSVIVKDNSGISIQLFEAVGAGAERIHP